MKVFFGLLVLLMQTSAYAFYADTAEEYEVSYVQNFKTEYTSIEEYRSRVDGVQRHYMRFNDINPTVLSAAGPLNVRHLGGPLKFFEPDIRWDEPMLINGRVHIPIYVRNRWLLAKAIVKGPTLQIPMFLNYSEIKVPGWEKCSDKDHVDLLWYYWDPSRSGCPHKQGVQWENVTVNIVSKTQNTTETYPDYARLIHIEDGQPTISMAFAYGYNVMPANPNPDADNEWGANNYRRMLQTIRSIAPKGFTETKVNLDKITLNGINQYPAGRRFIFTKNGIRYRISVYMESHEVYNTMFFMNSFAVENDSLFMWMGHSQIGMGFDPGVMNSMILDNPSIFKVSSDYQLLYWAGCSSYSYYGYPLFDIKQQYAGGNGTQNLDILTNGLPSDFSILPDQANYLMNILLSINPNQPAAGQPSFQTIVKNLDRLGGKNGVKIFANVLGDEDN